MKQLRLTFMDDNSFNEFLEFLQSETFEDYEVKTVRDADGVEVILTRWVREAIR